MRRNHELQDGEHPLRRLGLWATDAGLVRGRARMRGDCVREFQFERGLRQVMEGGVTKRPFLRALLASIASSSRSKEAGLWAPWDTRNRIRRNARSMLIAPSVRT